MENGSPDSFEQIIRIAIPSSGGRLHGHFGGCREFTFIDADAGSQVVLSMQTVPAPEHRPGLLPRWLQRQGVQVVIAGGIGRRALQILAQCGISVQAGPVGMSVKALAVDYLEGRLSRSPDACEHHGHHHDHGQGHHDGCHEH